jgi:uncharacterized paraquat-inducible protein A
MGKQRFKLVLTLLYLILYTVICGAAEAESKEASFYKRLDENKVWSQLCFRNRKCPRTQNNSTFCPRCKKRLIHRIHFTIVSNDVEKGKCKFCGQEIPGVRG